MIPVQLQPVLDHLWQSTLFTALAAVLTLGLRKNRAQIRYQLWLLASIKFLVPFSILIAVGEHLRPYTVSPISPVELQQLIEIVSEPLTPSIPVSTTLPGRASQNWLIPILSAVWVSGFLLLMHSWWRNWRSIRADVRKSSPLDLPIDLKVMTSPKFKEPAVFGITRPVLLLPAYVAERLTPPQMAAILQHELCHVRRRDNLAAAFHMVVQAVFWFHPLVWWLGARLMEERERACDEEVLRMGSEPQVYAEGILKICELCLQSPMQYVAGVTGGNLKNRIDAIMSDRAISELNFTKKCVLALAGVIAVAVPVILGVANSPAVHAQTSGAVESIPQWQTAAGSKMEFEVASIRRSVAGQFTSPSFPLDTGNAYKPTGGRFFADFPLTTFIQFAYKIRLTSEQKEVMLARLPKWVAEDRFTIQAKAPIGNPTKDQMRLMMQSLLADRFKLSIRFETREVPILAMLLVNPGKTGPKLRPHSEGAPCEPAATQRVQGSQGAAEVFPPVCDVTALQRQNGISLAGSRNTTTELIATALPSLGDLGHPVVDKTGLTGTFDFRLEWTQESDPSTNTHADLQKPTFHQALREQLGVKLESARGPIRNPVVDHIARPSEN